MERADLEQWRPRDVARLLALVESQRRYFQEIVASLPVGLLVLSSDLEIILANGAIRKIFELPSAGALRLRLNTVLPGWVLERVEQVLKTGEPQTNLLVEAERDGKRRFKIGILRIRSWDDEGVEEALLTVEELGPTSAGDQPATAASRAGELPKEAGQGIAASELVDNLDAVTWAVELSGMSFVFVSRQAETLLGFPPDFWINNPAFWADRVHPGDRERVIQFYHRVVESGTGGACEFRTVTADGRVVWLRETARLVSGLGGQPGYLAGLAVDVTERRLLEQQLVQSERVEAVAKLASRMAHDLNNMLMIPMGNAEELLNGLPAESPLRNEVQEILTATERMSRLTGHLLAFARKQAATAEIVDLEEVVSKVTRTLGVERKGGSSPSRVNANSAQLEKVLTAVIEAARKAVQPEARIAIETSIVEIREELRRANSPLRPGHYVALTITNGKLQRDLNAGTFERFLPEKDPADDNGTKLALAYGMVRQWGGDIALPNGTEGWLFRIFLERAPGPAEAPAGPSATEADTTLAPSTVETILVVEDEAGIRALVHKFLRKHGYEVLEAQNGEQALATVQGYTGRIDLLITDMVMPVMGGRELVNRLHEQGRDMKILYISGYTDDSVVYAAELPPGSAFLQKPFTLSSLLERVREVLKRD